MNEIRAICVFCASSQSVDESFKSVALELGRELGKKGIELVYGGASIGLMGCVARGVHEEKGRVIGVDIDESLMQPSEKGMVEDLIAAAYNDARAKADSIANEEMAKAQQGMGLPPGFKMPFS